MNRLEIAERIVSVLVVVRRIAVTVALVGCAVLLWLLITEGRGG